MYTGWGKPSAEGHVPLGSQVWLDPPKRPKQLSALYSCWALCFRFWKEDKGCTIVLLATTNKHELFLKDRILSGPCVHCFPQMFLMLTFSPFVQILFLGPCHFFKGEEGAKGERYGVLKMKTEFRVFLRSYKDQTPGPPF